MLAILLLILILLFKRGQPTTVEVIDFTEALVEDTFKDKREGSISF